MRQKFGGDSPCQLGVVKPDTQKKTQQGKGVCSRNSEGKYLKKKISCIWVFPKIGGKPPKWMVKIMENPIKIDDLGGFSPYFWKHPFALFEISYTNTGVFTQRYTQEFPGKKNLRLTPEKYPGNLKPGGTGMSPKK